MHSVPIKSEQLKTRILSSGILANGQESQGLVFETVLVLKCWIRFQDG